MMIGQTATASGADGAMAVTGSGPGPAISARISGAQYAGIFYNNDTSGDNLLVAFGTETAYTLRGSVTYNRGGGLIAYNTTSDYRVKEVKGLIENPLDRLMKLNPCRGRMVDAEKDIDFFVAHELQEVIPFAVTGDKDAVDDCGKPIYQMVDKSAAIPLLTAALQEVTKIVMQQQKDIEQLKKLIK